MFYHVIVTVYAKAKNSGDSYCEFDIDSEDLLLKEYVEPYYQKKEFFVGGARVNVSMIKSFQIMQTNETAETTHKMEYNSLKGSAASVFCTKHTAIRNDVFSKDVTSIFLRKVKELGQANESDNEKKQIQSISKNIFIVHGHDVEMKKSAELLVTKLEYNPIILNDKPSKGKTIIEKLEEYSDVSFAIILYSPDDITSEDKKRVRQNVVFEHGYLIGKLGRSRVCALRKGDVEEPSDISGIVYIPYDNGETWKYTVAKEMKAAGFDVDMNKI